MDRCALFVDAGYVLADGAMAVHGTRHRESVSWDYAGLLQFFGSIARDRTGLSLLRCYWYEATVEGRRSAEHDALADLPGLKLRLGRMRPGRREGVESEIHRDLTTLARNGAVSDALVVSAEEDLAQVVADVQDLGVRVAIVHITVDGNWTISRALRQECDDIIEIGDAHLRPFVELIAGAEPMRDDEQYQVPAFAGRALTNGHGSLVGSLGHQQALPAGSHPAPPAIYTAPVVAEYQRAAQPVMIAHQAALPHREAAAPIVRAAQAAQNRQVPQGQPGVPPPPAVQGPSGVPGPPLSQGQHGQQVVPGQPAAPGPLGAAAAPGQHSSSGPGAQAPQGTPGQPGRPRVAWDARSCRPRLARAHVPCRGTEHPGGGPADVPGPDGRAVPHPDAGHAGEPGAGRRTAGVAWAGCPRGAGCLRRASRCMAPRASRTRRAPTRGGTHDPAAAGPFPGPPPGQHEAAKAGPAYVSRQGPCSGPQPAAKHAPVPQPVTVSLADAVQSAHSEGFEFGQSVAREAPALWLEAVLARKPRMPSDLEARLLQDSALPIDSLLHDEVRHALRRGFWDALERSRR